MSKNKRPREVAKAEVQAEPAKRPCWRLSNGTLIYLDPDKCDRFSLHYNVDIRTLGDLVAIADFYAEGRVPRNRVANIAFASIYAIRAPVSELDALVGLTDFKAQVLELILFFLQRFDEDRRDDMLHTVVYGPPGCGKTTCIQILAKIYARLGILSEGKVITARRSDLIGKYLGHTAAQTRKVIESAFGSVLLIDEAYALGDTEQKDSFARECIDTLNQYLSEHRGDFICIVAGYEDDLKERFFKTNAGLERRFPFKMTIPPYSAAELRDIFVSTVRGGGWQVDLKDVDTDWFEKNRELLEFAGGDIQTLFTNAKFAHGRRVFCAERGVKKTLVREDVEAAFKKFASSDRFKKQRESTHKLNWLYT